MQKTLIKSLSWAVVSGVLIFGSTFSTTGLFWESMGAAFMACLLKTPVYAAHEPLFEHAYKRLFNRKKIVKTTRFPLPVICTCKVLD